MKKETEKDLYAPGEERFGPIGSRMYSSSRIIPAIGKFYKFVLEDLNSMEFQDLLDIGSGTGHVIITLAEMKQNFNGTGIDPFRVIVYFNLQHIGPRSYSSQSKRFNVIPVACWVAGICAYWKVAH